MTPRGRDQDWIDADLPSALTLEPDLGGTVDPEAATREISKSGIHPLVHVFVEAYRSGRDGIVTVSLPREDIRIPLTLRQGRVVSVSHESTTIQGVARVLARVGILSEQDLARAEREAVKRGVYLEDYLVQKGLVSKGTIAATREKAAVELLMDLLSRDDISVTVSSSQLRGIREAFSLPIPYLLKEAQRRSTLAPTIRRAVPGPDSVFAKASQVRGQGSPVRWEDLRLSAAERQVYFFVDGRRTVADLMLATAQSEFEVSRALHGLLEMQLVVPVVGGRSDAAIAHVVRSSTRRIAGMAIAIVCLLGAIYTFVNLEAYRENPFVSRANTPAFETMLREAPLIRLMGAIRIADLFGDVDITSHDDLVLARLALPEDRRAAMLLRWDRRRDEGSADDETRHEP